MFVLGHVGIGTRMLGRLRRRLPAAWLVLGCVLPDLIDKPLFYGLLWLSHRTLIHLGIVRGSRSFGHTLLFALLLLAGAAATRSRAAWAVFAGVATHLVLDVSGELISGSNPESSIWLALFWPLLGPNFPLARFSSPLEHLRYSLESYYYVAGEIVGGAILVAAWLERRRVGP